MNEKTLHNSDVSGARQNVPDIKVVGNGDMYQLLCKASSQAEGWMKSTKAMEVPGGCIVQVTTQQRNPDGGYAVAEALTFVPDVKIENDVNNGRKLVRLILVSILTLLALAGSVNAQTNTNAPSETIWSGLEKLVGSIGSSAPSNFVVAPYASYALSSSVSNHWGGGIFGAWNMNQNIGMGAAVDYADGGFTMFSGQLTLRLPTRPLSFIGWTNVVFTPFILGGVGTPVASAGHAVGGIASIAATGGAVDIFRFGPSKEWHFGLEGTFAQWSGAGPQDGKHIYGGLTLSRGF